MNTWNRIRKEGVALLTAVIFVGVAVALVGSLVVMVVYQHRNVDQYVTFREAFYGVDAAFAQSVANVEMGGTGHVGLGAWTLPAGVATITNITDLPTFDDPAVAPVRMASMPEVEYMAYVVDWDSDGVDNNGDGTIDGLDEDHTYTVYGLARDASTVRRAEGVFKGYDVNVWRNAIFGGSGQAGGLINGNVSIHGSVHLLGQNIPAGGVAVAALDLSGASLIHNNYGGLPAALAQRIPGLPTREFGGETVETLDAKLRVRRGLVGLSGNSEIGQPNAVGNAIKETMDGTYVNDGWTGNAVTPDGGRGDPKSVFSDNGWDEGYDLGNRVPFPVLDDDWRDPVTGATVINPNTGANYTHREYFHDQLAGTPYTGNIVIHTKNNFYYNATRPTDPDPAHRQPTDNYILYNSATKRMEINGAIEINGNLTFSGQGNDRTVNYTGRGCILAHGDVTIDTNLLTVNADGSVANSFPVNNIIGIMAEGSMAVGTAAQLQIMGAFYAQNEIRSEKQTTVIGTFVSDYFNMGTNVPDIYQVPVLADNLPYGMIGAYPIVVMAPVSWRELGV